MPGGSPPELYEREDSQPMAKSYRKRYRTVSGMARSEMRRAGAEDVTYIVEGLGTGRIKIGRTIHLNERLRGLQVGCPVKLLLLRKLSGGRHEAVLHRNLKQFRCHGEWYEKTETLVGYVNRYRRDDPYFQPIDHRPVAVST